MSVEREQQLVRQREERIALQQRQIAERAEAGVGMSSEKMTVEKAQQVVVGAEAVLAERGGLTATEERVLARARYTLIGHSDAALEALGHVDDDLVYPQAKAAAAIPRLGERLQHLDGMERFLITGHDEVTIPANSLQEGDTVRFAAKGEHQIRVTCTGADTCKAEVHVHGCFADTGECDSPDEHIVMLPNEVAMKLSDERRKQFVAVRRGDLIDAMLAMPRDMHPLTREGVDRLYTAIGAPAIRP